MKPKDRPGWYHTGLHLTVGCPAILFFAKGNPKLVGPYSTFLSAKRAMIKDFQIVVAEWRGGLRRAKELEPEEI